MKPDDIPLDVIESMCLTWRHDFGLMSPPADKDGRVAWSGGFPMGMTQQQKDGLRLQMRQLYQHHVLPVVMAATLAEREACAEIADGYRDKTPNESVRMCASWIGDDIRKRGEP